MIVTIAAIHPRMLVVIPVVIAIVEALAWWSRDDTSGAKRRDGEQQAADCNSCGVFHGVS
jgi:hypothetical protein